VLALPWSWILIIIAGLASHAQPNVDEQIALGEVGGAFANVVFYCYWLWRRI
jgi:hypothetical protein